MKTDKKATEHYLLPLNLCFLSFFGFFLIYELDKWLISGSQASASPLVLVASIIAVVFLTGSIKFRNPYFQALCAILAGIASVILI